jgi:hypothetical protein
VAYLVGIGSKKKNLVQSCASLNTLKFFTMSILKKLDSKHPRLVIFKSPSDFNRMEFLDDLLHTIIKEHYKNNKNITAPFKLPLSRLGRKLMDLTT